MELLFFLALGGLMVFSSIMVVAGRNPVTSAMFLVGQLFMLACVYAMLGADFVAAIQIIVYAGAIMVLFVFVIMLLNLQPDSIKGPNLPAVEIVMLILTVLTFAAISLYLVTDTAAPARGGYTPEAIQQAGGNTYIVGMEMFSTYLWPFELASILILLAIVASIVIAKKDKHTDKQATDVEVAS
jgi:NADH-quinone oxidoreductase subunit J